MKKTMITMLFMIVLQAVNFAQPLEIEGVWKMFEMKFAGEKQTVSMAITFSKDGKIILGNKDKGTWKLDRAKNTLTIISDFLMNIEGECTFSFYNKELHLTNSEKETSKFRRLSLQKNQEYNDKVVGKWELKEIDGKAYKGRRKIIIDHTFSRK
jgi:hypothetical protein